MQIYNLCFSVNDIACCQTFRVKENSSTCGLAPHPSSSEAAKRTAHLFRDLEQHLLHHKSQLSGKMQRLYIYICLLKCDDRNIALCF